MNCLEWFDPYIQKVIHLFSHPVWFIVKDRTLSCSCLDETSKEPKEGCPLCFGLGKKLKIYRVMASNQNTSRGFRGTELAFSEKNIVNVYYTDNPTDIKVGDYIYDKHCVDIVTDVYYERSDESDIVYWRIETQPKKDGKERFKALLRAHLRKAGYSDA